MDTKKRSNRQVGWHGGPFDCERSRRVFRRLNVRDKLAKEIAMVRREARAGRLKWTYDDVKSLIQPYPRRKADSVFENLGDQHQMDEWGKAIRR